MAHRLVEFDKERHEYRYKPDGRVIPNATRFLTAGGIIPPFRGDPNDLRKGYNRGSAIHLAAEYYDDGDLALDLLDPKIEKQVMQYIQFRKDTDCRILAMEDIVFDPDIFMAGRRDRKIILNC